MDDLNLVLFDKYRQMGRMLRIGRSPGELVAGAGGEADHIQPAQHTIQPEQTRDACAVHHRDIILGILKMNGSGMRQKDLAEEMCVSASTLSQMIRKLEEEELIERKSDPSDRRAAILDMTAAGRERAAIMGKAFENMLHYLFRNLSADDKREMIRLFDLILEDEVTC
ncbi:MAG: MarR family transcriptional regulator [Eubacterium sp.]|nr:MarR family transcriptional regulator [Eubacterium sp.]